jgi:hypothetical protein
MIDDMKKYTDELEEAGNIVNANLRDLIKSIREVLISQRGETFADNVILHGVWMLLSMQVSYIICHSNNNVESEFINEISRKAQFALGHTIETLLKENAGSGTVVTFMEKGPRGGNT